MTDAYIVDAVRTPAGRRNGGLASVHPLDLAAHALVAVLERSGVDPAAVDHVLLGCVDQIGAQAGGVARLAWLAAGLPTDVPGVALDAQCGSSQKAVHLAVQGVMAGEWDLVVAGGVESMSVVPLQSAVFAGTEAGFGDPFEAQGWRRRFGQQEVSQFRGAELVAEKWAITRATMEAYALESHRRAHEAWEGGRFDAEVAPVAGVTRDEGVRPDTTLEKMASLPALRPGGRITAATASQIADGAAALVLASERAVREHGLRARARVKAMTAVGSDPVMMLDGPIAATTRVLERAGLRAGDIDLFEVNEAFAPVVLAWRHELGVGAERVNVNGGGIALGHPLGATGAKLMTTLLHELERRGGRYGLQTMCEGGGMADATVVERLA
jgi:acetyl-CoA C-acetyltransferase